MAFPTTPATPVRAPWPPVAQDAAEWLATERTGQRAGARAFRTTLVVLLSLGMAASGLVVLGVESSSTGFGGFLIGVGLALTPLPVVIGALRWVDRYEPEPRSLLAFAFFWGATVAALVAAVLNTASAIIVARTSDVEHGLATTAVLVAPWVEEGVKGAAVLAVFLFRRREFDGVVDGIVLAGFAGIGFAFTENVLYFGRAFLAGSEQLGVTGGLFAAGVTFVLRGVFAPFAHPLFTTMTGIGLGLATSWSHRGLRLLAPVVGYLVAVALHATWNYASLSGLRGFVTGYVVIMIPAFVLTVAVTTWSRRREGATVDRWLPLYVQAGWLVPADVAMLVSVPRRRQAVAWARRTYGDRGSRALRGFQLAATELAFLRDRVERGNRVGDFAVRERGLLAELASTRSAIGLAPRG